MNQRFILFCRAGVFYCEDTETRKQLSLRTKNEDDARALLHAKNEALRQPVLNRQIARAYLTASDPQIAKRTWQNVMDEIPKLKNGSTRVRWESAVKSKAFDTIRNLVVLETRAEHFLRVLETGNVSANSFLRRIHGFALDMNWLPWPVLAKKRWPALRFKEKRAITWEEHHKILAGENNPEWRAFYQLLWCLGGAQTDIATLRAEDIDWADRTISYTRQKTGTMSLIRFGDSVVEILQSRPQKGFLFPMIALWKQADRGKAFIRRCRLVGVSGVSLHSYRYAWAERARTCGYPERFAQEALGHNSKAVHHANARKARVVIPNLDDYEKKFAAASAGVIVPMPAAVA